MLETSAFFKTDFFHEESLENFTLKSKSDYSPAECFDVLKSKSSDEYHMQLFAYFR